MAKVEFLGPIDKNDIDVDIKNLNELIKYLDDIKDWLEISAVAVNGKVVKDKNHPIKKDDTISILPPVCGG